MSRDIDKDVKVVSTIAPAAALTATTTGAAVDTVGYRSKMAIVHAGVATDGTITPSLEESDASGSGFAAVAAANLSGAFVAITSAADEVVQEVGYLGTKRYLRVVLTEDVASTGQFITASIVLADPITRPAA
jgi:hypothetical protein